MCIRDRFSSVSARIFCYPSYMTPQRMYANFTGYRFVVYAFGLCALTIVAAFITKDLWVLGVIFVATWLAGFVPFAIWLYYDATHTLHWQSKEAFKLVLKWAIGKRRLKLKPDGGT